MIYCRGVFVAAGLLCCAAAAAAPRTTQGELAQNDDVALRLWKGAAVLFLAYQNVQGLVSDKIFGFTVAGQFEITKGLLILLESQQEREVGKRVRTKAPAQTPQSHH